MFRAWTTTNKTLPLVALIATLAATLLTPVRAETLGQSVLVNGCFNNPYCGEPFCSAVSGNAIDGWDITSGSVEQLNGYVAGVPANCACGGSIDMNGQSEGTIEQMVTTVAGNNYAISFSYNANGGGSMDIFWCGLQIGTVTKTQSATWDTFAQVESASSSNCVLQFVSTTGGSGGVVPTNVQVVAIGSATTNTYPQVPVTDGCPTTQPTIPPTKTPTKAPTQSPTPAYYVLKATGKRCSEAGVLVPDNVWVSYPNVDITRRRLNPDGEREENQRRQLTPGVPDAEMCYVYCSNLFGVSTYYNLRTLATSNECYCCGATCTPVDDPEYAYYQVARAAPNDPTPPLPDYVKQGVGQRCSQIGTLATPFSPETEAQCWRICSNQDGTPQPDTYFLIKTSVTPKECYCVGPVCNVVDDPNYSYDRINNPAAPVPCIELNSVSVPRMIKGTAGGSAKYSMLLKGTNLGRVLGGMGSTAEFILTLPSGVGFGRLKVARAAVIATPIQGDSSIPPNTYVWKLQAKSNNAKALTLHVVLKIDGCHPGGMTGAVEGSFWPFGRQVSHCNFKYGEPSRLSVKVNPAKCVSLNPKKDWATKNQTKAAKPPKGAPSGKWKPLG